VRRRVALVLLVGLVTFTAAPAHADHTDLIDLDDVEGLLDLEEVRFRHDGGPYAWVFRTFAEWTTKKIWDEGFFVVRLDTMGSPEADYLALLRSTGREMQGELFRVRWDGSQKHIRSVDAWRAGRAGAGIEVPARFLTFGFHRTSFFWWTTSLVTSARCRTPCIDAVPDEGAIEQLLVEPVEPVEPVDG
jgi:hypothetical protein